MKKEEIVGTVQEPSVEYRAGSGQVSAHKKAAKPALKKNTKTEVHPVFARVTFSRLKSILEGKTYEILLDKRNGEQYVVDDNGDKVLFDKNIFQCEFV